MDYSILLKYLFLSLIEGLTEFLPLSSTAHLILFSRLLNIQATDFHKFYEIFIQSGAILAIIVGYFKYILNNRKLVFNLAISLLPTIVFGFLFYQIIKTYFFENYYLIIFNLILIGLVFIFLEKKIVSQGKIILNKDLNQLNILDSFLIGLFQSLAIVPGVSRAGAVILGMLFLNYQRKASALYSFLLAVPTIFLASIFDFYKTFQKIGYFTLNEWIILTIGFLFSFLSALFVVRWFISYLQKNNLEIFGWYRIIFGVIFFIFYNFII